MNPLKGNLTSENKSIPRENKNPLNHVKVKKPLNNVKVESVLKTREVGALSRS